MGFLSGNHWACSPWPKLVEAFLELFFFKFIVCFSTIFEMRRLVTQRHRTAYKRDRRKVQLCPAVAACRPSVVGGRRKDESIVQPMYRNRLLLSHKIFFHFMRPFIDFSRTSTAVLLFSAAFVSSWPGRSRWCTGCHWCTHSSAVGHPAGWGWSISRPPLQRGGIQTLSYSETHTRFVVIFVGKLWSYHIFLLVLVDTRQDEGSLD